MGFVKWFVILLIVKVAESIDINCENDKFGTRCFNKIFNKGDKLNLHNKTFVVFSNCTIKNIYVNLFESSKSLNKLYLIQNQVESIQKGAFNDLLVLSHLYLDHNKLTTIIKGTFNSLVKLETLSATYNEIVAIEVESFLGLTNLKELDLQRNKLAIISSGTFSLLHQLRILNLSFNNLEVIKNRTFFELKMLDELLLNNNRLKIVPSKFNEKTFLGLFNLRKLCLDDNSLTFLPNEMFKDLKKLNYLDFSDNKIVQCTSQTFAGLNELQILKINNNKLEKMPELEVLRKLEELEIKNNFISTIDTKCILSKLPNLNKIKMNGNQFSCAELSNTITLLQHRHINVTEKNTFGLNNVNGITCQNEQRRNSTFDYNNFGVSSTTATRIDRKQGNVLETGVNKGRSNFEIEISEQLKEQNRLLTELLKTVASKSSKEDVEKIVQRGLEMFFSKSGSSSGFIIDMEKDNFIDQTTSIGLISIALVGVIVIVITLLAIILFKKRFSRKKLVNSTSSDTIRF